jgi:hypothetical protein
MTLSSQGLLLLASIYIQEHLAPIHLNDLDHWIDL